MLAVSSMIAKWLIPRATFSQFTGSGPHALAVQRQKPGNIEFSLRNTESSLKKFLEHTEHTLLPL